MIPIRSLLAAATLAVAFLARPAAADTNHSQGHDDNGDHSQDAQAVQGEGTIKAIDSEQQQITLTHGPVEALGWPAMTMPFKVSERNLLEGVAVGEKIRSELGSNTEIIGIY